MRPCINLLLIGLVVMCTSQSAISGKFKNLTNRKLSLFWVNHNGEPQLNSYVNANEETSFATYVPHRFFWAEMGATTPTTAAGTQPEQVEFRIEAGKFVYSITDASSDLGEISRFEEEATFMAQYEARTGRAWLGEVPRPPPIFGFREAPHAGFTTRVRIPAEAGKWLCDDAGDPGCRGGEETLAIRTISVHPRAFLVDDFLSDYECDKIIDFHRPRMTPSRVGNGENAKQESVRSSKSDRMERSKYPEADAIYRRLAAVLDLPQELLVAGRNQEAINIVEYQKGQQYTPHFDTGIHGREHHRFISTLLYFNTPARGGGTSFPRSPLPDGGVGLEVPAQKRQMLFFYDLLPDGNFDEYSLHAGLPVEEGEKWIGAAWTWEPHISHGKSDMSAEDLAKYQTAFEPSLFTTEGRPILEPSAMQAQRDGARSEEDRPRDAGDADGVGQARSNSEL